MVVWCDDEEQKAIFDLVEVPRTANAGIRRRILLAIKDLKEEAIRGLFEEEFGNEEGLMKMSRHSSRWHYGTPYDSTAALLEVA